MRFDKSSVGAPHDLVEFPELPEEARVTVVHTFSILTELRVVILFNIPDAVGKGAALCAGDFLLLITPVRKFDFVREKNATSHSVDKLEFGLDGAETFLCFRALGEVFNNFNAEDIVRVTFKTLVSISRNLILPFCLCNRRPDIMRMQTPIGRSMVQPNQGSIFNQNRRENRIET